MKRIVFNRTDYEDYDGFFVDLFERINTEMIVPIKSCFNANTEFYIKKLLDSKRHEKMSIIFYNFDLLFCRYNRDSDNCAFIETLDFFEDYASNSLNLEVRFLDKNPTPFEIPTIKKEIIFDRKKYKSYKDFYTQIYKELDGKHNLEFEDCEDLHYNIDFLDEFLPCYHDDSNKYIFIGFDKARIKEERTYDDYKYNMIFKVFERFVREYPNNALEFRDE